MVKISIVVFVSGRDEDLECRRREAQMLCGWMMD